MSNVRKSTVSRKTNKEKDVDKEASTKKAAEALPADSEAVTKPKKSSS
jgi:hypothetical protein